MITLRIDSHARLSPIKELPGAVMNLIINRLTFQNPTYLEAEKRGFWTGNIAREIRCYFLDREELTTPRGFARQLTSILHYAGIKYEIYDFRLTLPKVDFSFNGNLRDYQQEAVEAMAARDFGTLAAPTGSGKTVVALALIAKRRQPALVVCHAKELQEQWIDRIETFLGIPRDGIGVIGGGKMKVGDKITVGLVQSLYKCAGEVAPHVGFLIVDEAHRCPSRTFTEAVMAFDCRYMTGLSATLWRRDGLLIWWYLGDKVHEIDKDALVEAGHVLRAEVIWRKTDFEPTFDPSEEYSRMLSELTQDPDRNALIADDVAKEAQNGGGVCLLLSDRKAHCEALSELLAARGIAATVLTGDIPTKERQAIVAALNSGQIKVLVATGQLIGEGFDCQELSTLFLATPIRFNGRLVQYLGRILRPASGKGKARVFDYMDPVGVLENAARARERVYGPQGE